MPRRLTYQPYPQRVPRRSRRMRAPVKLSVFELIERGEYAKVQKRISELEDWQQLRFGIVKRLEKTKYLPGIRHDETTENYLARARYEGSNKSLGETLELYRRYSSERKEDIDRILKDPEPFNITDEETGDHKNPEYDLGDYYSGTYVTLDKDIAINYATRHEFGILVTFDWTVIRALYVKGELAFGFSNDTAEFTSTFEDHFAVEKMLTLIAPDLPELELTKEKIHSLVFGEEESDGEGEEEEEEEVEEDKEEEGEEDEEKERRRY